MIDDVYTDERRRRVAEQQQDQARLDRLTAAMAAIPDTYRSMAAGARLFGDEERAVRLDLLAVQAEQRIQGGVV